MQRLEIIWLPNFVYGTPDPLTDEAGYWDIKVKSCDDQRYYEVVGYGEDGEAGPQHVASFSLVRSVSAREIGAGPGSTSPEPGPEGGTE